MMLSRDKAEGPRMHAHSAGSSGSSGGGSGAGEPAGEGGDGWCW